MTLGQTSLISPWKVLEKLDTGNTPYGHMESWAGSQKGGWVVPAFVVRITPCPDGPYVGYRNSSQIVSVSGLDYMTSTERPKSIHFSSVA